MIRKTASEILQKHAPSSLREPIAMYLNDDLASLHTEARFVYIVKTQLAQVFCDVGKRVLEPVSEDAA